MYKLEYLPIARQDMIEIVTYIRWELNNPTAADSLAAALIEAGERIAEFPYSNPAYIPIRTLEHEYRKAVVRNYLIFYRVDEEKKLVTVARVIYAGRNYENLLK